MAPKQPLRAPLLWRIDLSALARKAGPGGGSTAGVATPGRAPESKGAGASPWAEPIQERLAAWGGAGLALAYLLGTPRRQAGLVLAVGDAVRRGLPTAARGSIFAPSPLTGGLGEGLVGSDLARRLAVLCDVLALEGCAPWPDAVLVLDGDGARLMRHGGWAELDPEERRLAAESSYGPCAILRSGPAARGPRPVAFANLAAGGDPPSFVGRGLGAALALRGLLAIVVTTGPAAAEEAPLLRELLARSPRLQARAEGGTLELAESFAARGQLLGPEGAQDLAQGAREARSGRHGCRGCPTPCGWVFDVPGAGRSGARFSALQALGEQLGLAGFDEPSQLLASCNRLGLDAKEAAAGLALLVRAGGDGRLQGAPRRGDLASQLGALEDLVQGRGAGQVLVPGAAAAARALGLPLQAAGDEAVRDGGDLGSLLGACAGVRGAEPMRTFPFLLEGGAGEARLERLLHPWSLPPGAADPEQATGTGRVVAWHEDLVAGVDLSGFCAFSAAGLLGDGVCDAGELSLAITPASIHANADLGADPAARLLSAGASLNAALRLLRSRWGLAPRPIPDWAQERLGQPGVLDEYRAVRGLDGRGELLPERRASIGQSAIRPLPPLGPSPARSPGGPGIVSDAGAASASGLRPKRIPGRVQLLASGALGRRLGAPLELDLDLPAPAQEVIASAAALRPGAADWLLRDGIILPALWRRGSVLTAEGLVQDGDSLELLMTVSGG